jgi:hypothetical protein
MEFEDDSVDSGWAVMNIEDDVDGTLSEGTIDAYDTSFTSGNAVRVNQNVSTRPSWMLIQAPAHSPYKRFCLYRSVSLETNVCILARMKFNLGQTIAGEDFYLGLALSLANAGKPELKNSIELFLNETEPGQVQAECRKRDASGVVSGIIETSAVSTQGQALEYVALHKIGSDYHCWVGTGTGQWIYMNTYPSLSYTPDLLTIQVSNISSSQPGPSVVGLDFIRFFPTANFLF